MQIAREGALPRSSDFTLIGEWLPLQAARLLELGCGAAQTTRRLAESHPVREIVAMEVDRVQHAQNLLITDLPQVTFAYGGAEAIALPDASVDAVIMLKSLHHVPVDALDTAFGEIRRVLRPGGLAYISEPVYAGEFNELLRLFHDEREVRAAAFDATRRAVDRGQFVLDREYHFNDLTRFADFAEFERRVLGATHSAFRIDDGVYATVRDRFIAHAGDDGSAEFLTPLRADLLRRRG